MTTIRFEPGRSPGVKAAAPLTSAQPQFKVLQNRNAPAQRSLLLRPANLS